MLAVLSVAGARVRPLSQELASSDLRHDQITVTQTLCPGLRTTRASLPLHTCKSAFHPCILMENRAQTVRDDNSRPSHCAQSSNLRRNVIGEASLYREHPDVQVVDVKCSTTIRDNDGSSVVFKMHPLCKKYWSSAHCWSMCTSDWCWHCCHSFTGCVHYAPYATVNENSISVYGNFCSLPCTKRYIMDQHMCMSAVQLMLLKRVARDVYGHTGYIKPAPPKVCLKVFGGDMQIDTFRQGSADGTITNLVEPPFVPHTVVLEIISRQNRPHGLFPQEVDEGVEPVSGAHAQPPKPADKEHVATDLSHHKMWSVHGLRRPVQPMSLPRAVTSGGVEPRVSLLERFAESRDSGADWDTNDNHYDGCVASCTPTVDDVRVAVESKQANANASTGESLHSNQHDSGSRPLSSLANFVISDDEDDMDED